MSGFTSGFNAAFWRFSSARQGRRKHLDFTMLRLFGFQGGPQLEQRFESYYNYCNLFNYILSKNDSGAIVI